MLRRSFLRMLAAGVVAVALAPRLCMAPDLRLSLRQGGVWESIRVQLASAIARDMQAEEGARIAQVASTLCGVTVS